MSGGDGLCGMQWALVPVQTTPGQLDSRAWSCIRGLGRKPCFGSRQIQLRAEAIGRVPSWGRQGQEPPEAGRDQEGSVF